MRFSLALILVAACGGGGASTQPTTPTSAPPPPAPEAAPPAAAENDTSVCANRDGDFGPLTLDAGQAAKRRGKDVTKYSQIKTTKEKPIEVCGIGQQQAWLMAATCDDGSRPFDDRNTIRDARRGNVGAGGTCGTIIDLYVATCPEAQYELHLDMYHCGPGESFM